MPNYEYFKVVYKTADGTRVGVELANNHGVDKTLQKNPDETPLSQMTGNMSFADVLGMPLPNKIEKLRFFNKPGASICCITINNIDFYYWC
jgi:hypothetical protein